MHFGRPKYVGLEIETYQVLCTGKRQALRDRRAIRDHKSPLDPLWLGIRIMLVGILGRIYSSKAGFSFWNSSSINISNSSKQQKKTTVSEPMSCYDYWSRTEH